jgi:hypothetical protein
MTTIPQPRRTAGIPQGGEFATHQRAAAIVTLDTPADAALARWNLTAEDVISVSADGEGGKTAHIFLRDYDAKGGYNEIREMDGGALSFLRDGKLHNENGWALDWRTGNDDQKDWEAYLNGERLQDPDESIGHCFTGRTDYHGEPASIWTACDYETRVFDNGRTEFWLDGDLHRDGAPAIIASEADQADGIPDLWFSHGTLIWNPRPAAPQRETYGTGDKTFTRVFGSRFESGRDVKDTAVLLRDHLAHAKRAGLLPSRAEITVRTRKTTVPHSIDITVTGIPNRDYLNPNRELEGEPFRSAAGTKLYKQLDEIVSAYNRWEEGPEASEAVSFYSNVAVRP